MKSLNIFKVGYIKRRFLANKKILIFKRGESMRKEFLENIKSRNCRGQLLF